MDSGSNGFVALAEGALLDERNIPTSDRYGHLSAS